MTPMMQALVKSLGTFIIFVISQMFLANTLKFLLENKLENRIEEQWLLVAFIILSTPIIIYGKLHWTIKSDSSEINRK